MAAVTIAWSTFIHSTITLYVSVLQDAITIKRVRQAGNRVGNYTGIGGHATAVVSWVNSEIAQVLKILF